jgi:hypothetical protein
MAVKMLMLVFSVLGGYLQIHLVLQPRRPTPTFFMQFTYLSMGKSLSLLIIWLHKKCKFLLRFQNKHIFKHNNIKTVLVINFYLLLYKI